MNITLESDYAVRIVYRLAQAGQRIDAKRIAEKTCVTLRFALKILRKLAETGIVKSYKGTQGGYELAKEPQDISLREVLEAIEGPYTFSRCMDDEYDCTKMHGDFCPFKAVYESISLEVRGKLSDVTFDKIISRKTES